MKKRPNRSISKFLALTIIFYLKAFALFSQEKISGYITDREDKLPLYPVSVVVKGSAQGTLTDSTGFFRIAAKIGSTLIFSFVGHESMEVVIRDETVLHLSLLNSIASLNQVVMTGYTSQVVKEITGSVTVVRGTTLTTDPVGQVDQTLQGRASGLTVISPGEPGAASVVRINGIGNFGDVTPLYIIDGIQGDINTLNAYDIETVQILKDAGAYSIYGVRGANGVIVITTRKGRIGKSVISLDAYVGYQVPLNHGLNLANPQGQADMLWRALKNTGEVDPSGNPYSPLYGNGPNPVLPAYTVNGVGYPAGSPMVDASLYNITPPLYTLYQIMEFNQGGTDWFHTLFKPAWNQNYTVSASGGNNKNHYLFSMGYLNQQGTFVNTYLKKFTARINTEFNISDDFRIGENLLLNQSQTPRPSPDLYRALIVDPSLPVYDIKGNASSPNGNFAGPADNPLSQQELARDNANDNWQVLGNAFLELNFLKHFLFRSSFGGSFDFYNNYNYTFGTYDQNISPSSFAENSGYMSSWTLTNTLAYDNVFAGKNHLKILAGTEYINNYLRGQGGTSQGYFSNNPNLRFLGNGNSVPADQSVNSFASSTFLASFISALEYGFNEKYFFSATLRRDASSVFSSESRVGWFPSFSAAWRITQESFVNIAWLSELKLRGSWGISGYNGNTTPLNQYNLYGANPSNSFYDINGTSTSAVAGLALVQIGNTKTGWQQDYMTDIGLEGILWNGKFSFTVDLYNKQSDGLLIPAALPGILGAATTPNTNIGKIQNQGINITLGTKGNFSKDFAWNANIAFTAYKTKVLQLNELSFYDNPNVNTQYGPMVRNSIGYPVGSFFGYKIVGFFQDDADIARSPQQEAAAPGRFKYADANRDGVINTSDRIHLGDPSPVFTIGINIGFTYKNFDFSSFSYWSYGNDVFSWLKRDLDIFPGLFHAPKSLTALNDSWTPDHHNAKAPLVEDFQNFSNNAVVNSYPLEKGSYFRNKSMILGYTLPASAISKYKIQKFRIYAEVVNLFTITNYSGMDPELSGIGSAEGVDFGNYPNNQRQYLLGISLNF